MSATSCSDKDRSPSPPARIRVFRPRRKNRALPLCREGPGKEKRLWISLLRRPARPADRLDTQAKQLVVLSKPANCVIDRGSQRCITDARERGSVAWARPIRAASDTETPPRPSTASALAWPSRLLIAIDRLAGWPVARLWPVITLGNPSQAGPDQARPRKSLRWASTSASDNGTFQRSSISLSIFLSRVLAPAIFGPTPPHAVLFSQRAQDDVGEYRVDRPFLPGVSTMAAAFIVAGLFR